MTEHNTLSERVVTHYEDFPYPSRDPQEEQTRLLSPPLDMLGRLNHYGFRGHAAFDAGFSALVAGGGTGDAAIYLAHQLAPVGGRVTYIDPSRAARKIAEARAAVRGLSNIRFMTGELETLPDRSSEPFDYINCTGVLHHLADPLKGLRDLSAVLKPQGAMAIMVYGLYGRMPNEHLRQAFAPLISDMAQPDAVSFVQDLLAHLPSGSYFAQVGGGAGFVEALRRDRAEIADLLVHPREVSYDVIGLYELIESAGLTLSSFSGFLAEGGAVKASYMPQTYLSNPRLLRKLTGLPLRDQQAFCEKFSSAMTLHSCYVTRDIVPEISVEDAGLYPYFFVPLPDAVMMELHEAGVRPVLIHDGEGTQIDLTPGPDFVRLLRLFDGKHSFGDLVRRLRNEILTPRPIGDMDRIASQTVQSVYDLFHRFDWMLASAAPSCGFRHPGRTLALRLPAP